MTRDGDGEAVVGIVMMLMGENSRVVVNRVKDAISEIEKSLPEGVTIDTFYDRTELVRRTILTVTKNLTEGGLLVIVVLLLLLGNLRGGLIVASAIPLSMLAAFTAMRYFGISGNLMSLGAIDFGLIVDGSVVMVENIVRVLHERRSESSVSRLEKIRGGLAPGRAARGLRGRDHHDRLPPDPRAARHRGKDVPPHGADGRLRTRGLPGLRPDPDAGPLQPLPQARLRERALVVPYRQEGLRAAAGCKAMGTAAGHRRPWR